MELEITFELEYGVLTFFHDACLMPKRLSHAAREIIHCKIRAQTRVKEGGGEREKHAREANIHFLNYAFPNLFSRIVTIEKFKTRTTK